MCGFARQGVDRKTLQNWSRNADIAVVARDLETAGS